MHQKWYTPYVTITCIQCSCELPATSPSHRKFCSGRCKARYRKIHCCDGKSGEGHQCRECGALFPIGPGQHNKWLCSDECRRKSAKRSIREFHGRRPQMERIYRARTKERFPIDRIALRFYRLYPDAPRACEACGESRVVEIAHKPNHARFGTRVSSKNLEWPKMVWVLCPTCHELIDRMHYDPAELGLIP